MDSGIRYRGCVTTITIYYNIYTCLFAYGPSHSKSFPALECCCSEKVLGVMGPSKSVPSLDRG